VNYYINNINIKFVLIKSTATSIKLAKAVNFNQILWFVKIFTVKYTNLKLAYLVCSKYKFSILLFNLLLQIITYRLVI
jgi:hypothetical protein